MLSMTGFGNGEGVVGKVTVTVELRSVNHRFLDVSLKLPGSLASSEAEIRQFLKGNVARGRVTVAAQMTIQRDAVPEGLDQTRLQTGLAMLKEVAKTLETETGLAHQITLDQVMTIPDLFKSEEQELDTEDVAAALMIALKTAHKGLMQMKQDEGAALVVEMTQRLDTLNTHLAQVVQWAPLAADEIKTRLEERLEKILSDVVDPQRLAMEVAMLADKGNINEECERLGIHLAHFRKALLEGGQVAKRLNFLLQEMHREVNTMGSKTNLMDITTAVITMKDEVESMREQIMNLE